MDSTSIILCITLLWLSSTCQAQHTFQTCAKDPDTCSYFFDAIRDKFFERSILHTLRKVFFPTRGMSPILFDVFMTVRVEQMPSISCTSSEYPFANQPITTKMSAIQVPWLLTATATPVFLSSGTGSISGAEASSIL